MSQPSKSFGRYSLVRKIAQGGMAEIFLARFRGAGGFEKKVIIKRILPRFSQNREFIEMLVHEAKLAVQLHHANVVQIYDLGRVKDAYFISMEYIRGKDLRTVLSRLRETGRPLPPQLTVFIAREICKGLDYAHAFVNDDGRSLNLVHRDISPPNILLSLEGEVKIIDFGIAKATARATDTQAGVFKGKFAYMSPEQASGGKVDRRTDIFAAGLVLYEMLTNVKLLEGESDVVTLDRARGIDRLDLSMNQWGVPAELERIVRRALAGDIEKRYQHAGEMARDLTIYLNTRYPSFIEGELGRFIRRLFNLDRRPREENEDEDTDPSMIPSLTGSLELVEDRVAATLATTQNLALGRPADDLDVWSLEAELMEDIDVIPTGGGGAGGGLAVAADGGQWVSELASSWRPTPTGTGLRPVVSDSLVGHPAPEVPDDGTLRSAAEAARTRSARLGGAVGAVAAVLVLLVGLGLLTVMPRGAASGLPGPLLSLRHHTRIALSLPTMGLVALKVAPVDAQVQVDGITVQAASLGTTALELATGVAHPVDASADGYTPASISVTPALDAALETVLLNLEPRAATTVGRLMVSSEPAGARIFLNGAEVPGLRTPAEVPDVPAGQPVRIRLTNEGYQDWEAEVVASVDVPTAVTATLGVRPVTLTVISSPDGAEISLDGRPPIGQTPLRGALLQADAVYRLRVSKPGYQPYEEELHTELGKDLELRFSLAPLGSGTKGAVQRTTPRQRPQTSFQAPPVALVEAPPPAPAPAPVVARQATVNIIVRPEGLATQVYLNGQLLGTAPIRDHELPAGAYVVRLRSEGVNLDQAWQKEISDKDIGRQIRWEFEIESLGP